MVDSYFLEQEINDSGTWVEVQNDDSLTASLSALQNNRYSYRVSACNASGCSDPTAVATVEVFIDAPTPDNKYDDESTPFTQPQHDPSVGAMPADFDVDADGNANYTLPIRVPPGLGGIAPQLALTYNSGSNSEGMIGVGWGLAGFSVIHRCATTLERDGSIDGVDYDGNDKFCLDGQRLVSFGSNQYRTEVDKQTKIIATGNSSTPTSFEVRTPDGKIFQYGSTHDSRIEAYGTTPTYIWALSHVRDRYHNEMTFTYIDEAEHLGYRPLRIDYAKNATTGVGPHHSVRFEYADKASPIVPQYAAGIPTKNSQLLTQIKTYAGETLLRDYEITYDYLSRIQRPVVSQVQECSGAGVCLPVTSMAWQFSAFSFGSAIRSDLCSNDRTCDHDNYPYIFYPDINGDAISDFCYRSDTGIQCRLGNGAGGWGTVINTNICANGSNLYGRCDNSDNYDTIQFVDINTDGKSDLVFRSDAGMRVFQSTGSSFRLVGSSTVCASSRQCDSDNYRTIQYPDINGDARPDLCYRGDTGIRCYLGDGAGGWSLYMNSTLCANDSSSYGGCNSQDNYDTIAFVDVNNDGKSDLVFRSDLGMRVFEFNLWGGISLIGSSTLCTFEQSL